MEYFFLWRPGFEPDHNRLSFLVSPIGGKSLCDGTRDMIEQMLVDLGLPDVHFLDWSFRHMVSNYLADDPDARDWQDVWKDVWEITVIVSEPVTLQTEPDMLCRTFAHDITWKGDPEQTRPYLPAPGILIADFYTYQDLDHFEEVFEKLIYIPDNHNTVEMIHKTLPSSSSNFINKIYRMTTNLSSNRILTFQHRKETEWPYQVFVGIDPIDTTFMEYDAIPLDTLAGLCYELGGTTSWQDLQDVMLKLRRVQKHFGTNSFHAVDAASIMRLEMTRVERYLKGWSEYKKSNLKRIEDVKSQEYYYKFI